jgi:hypothetical protein
MNPRVFTNSVEWHHLAWLKELLQLEHPHNTDIESGIDLVDGKIGLELKSRLQKYSLNFAVHAYQVDEYPAQLPHHALYWAFLYYDLSKPVKELEVEEIADTITEREVWFFDWDWIRPFSISPAKTGPYIYVHKRDFPPEENFIKMKEKGGTLYVPKNRELEERLSLPF